MSNWVCICASQFPYEDWNFCDSKNVATGDGEFFLIEFLLLQSHKRSIILSVSVNLILKSSVSFENTKKVTHFKHDYKLLLWYFHRVQRGSRHTSMDVIVPLATVCEGIMNLQLFAWRDYSRSPRDSKEKRHHYVKSNFY